MERLSRTQKKEKHRSLEDEKAKFDNKNTNKGVLDFIKISCFRPTGHENDDELVKEEMEGMKAVTRETMKIFDEKFKTKIGKSKQLRDAYHVEISFLSDDITKSNFIIDVDVKHGKIIGDYFFNTYIKDKLPRKLRAEEIGHSEKSRPEVPSSSDSQGSQTFLHKKPANIQDNWYASDIIYIALLKVMKRAHKNISEFDLNNWIDLNVSEKGTYPLLQDNMKKLKPNSHSELNYGGKVILDEFERGSPEFEELRKISPLVKSKFHMVREHFPQKEIVGISVSMDYRERFNLSYRFKELEAEKTGDGSELGTEAPSLTDNQG